MANNIYIGNRYVPVFANPVEWNNLREYEPLTMVTYQGTTYTSRQTVPVGTALDNTDYWVVTGNYNAQVDEYRQETAEVSTGLTSEITNRTDADYMLSGGDLLCIGDSYLKGSTPEAGVYIKSWGDYLADHMGRTINVNYFKYAYGGAGFVNTVDGHNFGTLLADAHNDIENPNKVGTIVVLGGRNDGTSNNLLPNLRTFISNAKTYFPNAKIYYTYGSAFISDTPRTILFGTEMYERANGDAIYLGNSSKYFSAYKNAYYDSQGTHPSADGQQMLGDRIFGAINGAGMPSITRDNLTLEGDGYYLNRIANDVYTFGSYDRQERILEVENFNANGQTLAFSRSFAEDDNFYFNRTSANYFTCHAPCVMQIGGTSGKYYFGTCIVRLNGTTVSYYPIAINDDNSGHVTGTLTKLYIHPFEMQIPVELI